MSNEWQTGVLASQAEESPQQRAHQFGYGVPVPQAVAPTPLPDPGAATRDWATLNRRETEAHLMAKDRQQYGHIERLLERKGVLDANAGTAQSQAESAAFLNGKWREVIILGVLGVGIWGLKMFIKSMSRSWK